MCLDTPNVCAVQVRSHEAASQSARLVFICVHREHYDFLQTLAPQLKGKVSRGFDIIKTSQNQSAIFVL